MDEILLKKAIKKAVKSPKILTYRVVALGFDKKGDFIGLKTNKIGKLKAINMGPGKGIHAERELIKRYGKRIKKIIIIRSGRTGTLLPIDPCPVCKKIINKLGIKVESFFIEN